jgi:CheY-like chemotaxis protein
VRDSGIGIKHEDQSLVFEEFRQVDAGITRQQEGTGLGLALVRRLVHLHGGTISLESALGEGSCFTVTLPLTETAAREQPARGSPALSDGADLAPEPSLGLSVVVVEDDREASELLTLHLTRAGYDVRRSSQDTALDVIQEVHPFAVTLDVLMPGRDGWDILQALKATPVTKDIPVVIVSVVDNRELGLTLGASDYLVKPVDRDALVASLARLGGS